jgi:predicted dehydrogenase
MKAAIIGMGPMGVRHIAAVGKVPDLELVAVCDSRAEAIEKAGLDARVGRFLRADDLLSEARPDLVILSTTAPSHHALTRAALQSGVRRILCEKPVACSLEQARDMLDRAAACGAVLAVNHCRRHVPAYQWLAGKIRSGEWGALRGVRSACPGIGLGCLATHFIDLLRFLGGEDFVEVFGWVDPEKGANPRGACFHDPGGLIVATGASGARYVHHQIEDAAGPYSLTLDLTSARVSVEEREGKISVIWRDPSVKPGPGRPPRFESIACPDEAPLRLDLVEMTAGVLRDLVRGTDLACAGEHGYKSLEVVVAAYGSSAAGHRAVSLPLAEPDLLSKELPIT